ncbi:CU044_5270 family protein [Amycolatopsis sp. NPDC026612]|uniref:CU044_5270 family protein n=1 Tax=Amycolatopsis sp. NPDC026612 TaxID=3155466 RepID=UPI0033E2922A
MDDLQLLRDFTGPAVLPASGELARKRAELIAATTARRPARRRPGVWAGLTAAGLAAAAAAAVVLTPAEDVVRPGPVSPAPSVTDPVRILRTAAAKARALPDLVPRSDQFVYTRTRLANGLENETWASVDGTHDGLAFLYGHEASLAGCRDGKRVQKESRGRTVTNRCVPHPAAPADLPTDADAMLAYLHQSTYGEGDTLLDLGNEIVTLAEGYLRPAARAALYEAVAKVPGLVVRTDAKDGTGRAVLGITWDSTTEHGIGNQDYFLFDPVTFAYLGVGTGVVVSQGIVDAVRQRP